MTERNDRRRSGRWIGALLPVVLVLVAVVFAVRALGGDDDAGNRPAPLDVAASGPRFATLDELADAADLIVEGRIVRVDEGRVITDPSNPDAGFSTKLFQLDVTAEFGDPSSEVLIVEQEAALLDGTPIVVNGLAPNQVGDVGVWFLVRGNDEEFPYVALVNEQGRLLYDEAESTVDVFGNEMTVDALREQLRQR